MRWEEGNHELPPNMTLVEHVSNYLRHRLHNLLVLPDRLPVEKWCAINFNRDSKWYLNALRQGDATRSLHEDKKVMLLLYMKKEMPAGEFFEWCLLLLYCLEDHPRVLEIVIESGKMSLELSCWCCFFCSTEGKKEEKQIKGAVKFLIISFSAYPSSDHPCWAQRLCHLSSQICISDGANR